MSNPCVFYLVKASAQLPWLMIFVGAILVVRRSMRPHALIQCIGSGILCCWAALDTILLDPHFGLLRHRALDFAPAWVTWQSWLLGIALLGFGVSYLLERLYPEPAAAD